MNEISSCIYRGTIRHRRRTPVMNAFKFPAYMMYVDLEELESLFRRRLLWSAHRMAPARFRRSDHLKELGDSISLRDAVLATLRKHGVQKEIGPIRLLTQFRHFGYEMNPVSLGGNNTSMSSLLKIANQDQSCKTNPKNGWLLSG